MVQRRQFDSVQSANEKEGKFFINFLFLLRCFEFIWNEMNDYEIDGRNADPSQISPIVVASVRVGDQKSRLIKFKRRIREGSSLRLI